ncbi:MAG: acetate--CoA ligase family protein [Paracoccaceae bacterium]
MRDLSRLFRPRSIAVFGGDRARNVIEQCLNMGFDGPIWPVHPYREEIAGVRCYRSVDEIPGLPDAAFVGVNREATVGIVDKLARVGAGGAACYAAGFTEAGDATLQEELVRAAGEMPVLGPNCYGIINYLDGALLWPDHHGGRRVERGVGIISQSSNIAINMTMQARALPIAYVACVGNQAQTGIADITGAMLQDDRVTAIGYYIEGIGDAADFAQAANLARRCERPLVAIKAGKTAHARSAAASHTAALAGEGAVSSAFLRRCGVVEVDDLPELIETLKILHVAGPIAGRRLCSLSCSGGEAGLVADLAARLPIEFPYPESKDALRDALGPIPAVSNPLDYHMFVWGDEAALTPVFTSMMQGGYDAALLVLDFPKTGLGDISEWEAAVRAASAARRQTGVPTVVAASFPENMPEARAGDLLKKDLVPVGGLSVALRSISAAMRAADFAEDAFAPVPPMARASASALDEAQAKAVLMEIGVRVPNGCCGKDGDVLRGAAMLSEPLAVKALGLSHKTEAGAVVLGVARDAVAAAMTSVGGAGRYLVEEMVTDAVAEVLVGLRRDAVYGASLTIAIGGVEAELLADTRTLVLPVSASDVRRAFLDLRMSPLLTGYRGRPRADLDAAIGVVTLLAAFLEGRPDIAEIEINPLMLRVEGQGAVAADALITLQEI